MLRRFALCLAISFGASACLDISDTTEQRPDAGKGGNGIDGGGGFPSGGSKATGGASGSGAMGGSAGTVTCSACTTGTAPPAPPSGWSYVSYAEKPAANAPCPAGYANPQTLTDNLKDNGCEGCGCTASGACSIQVTKFATTDCSGTPSSNTMVASGACVDSGSALGVNFSTTTVGGASCTVSNQLKPLMYNEVELCSADAHCPCLTVPTSPFYPGTCVMADAPGDQTCPTGYGNKKTFGEGIDDTRDCTAGCSCTPGCTVTSTVECAAGCSGGCVGIASGLGCFDATQPFGYGISVDVKCTPSGYPQKTGTVAPKALRVVCCKLGPA